LVDKSLSRALADRVLEEMSRLASEYGSKLGAVLGKVPRKRTAVERQARDLAAAGEAAYLAQVIGRHPKWRWASTCAFIPHVHQQDAAAERTVDFLPLRTALHVDRVGAFDPNVVPVLAINEHAVERLFLRLNVREPAAVREELHDAIFMSIHLLNAARRAGLNQAVVPTRSGAFLCSIEANRLLAKTWIAWSGQPCRHTEPARLARQYFQAAGGEHGLGIAIGSLPLQAPFSSIEGPEGLAPALAQIAWLHEPYARRADPVGDAWRAARAQQDRPATAS
jgi:hypothetical protein